MPEGAPRFWFGYLEAEDNRNSSLVVYDTQLNRGQSERVLLYHLKRDKILPYLAHIVRQKLRGLSKEEEFALVEYARDNYFPARAAWSWQQVERDSTEIAEIKAEMARDQRLYEAEHAGDRFKSYEDWANEYLQSNDSGLRELGRMMLGTDVPDVSDQARADAKNSDIARVMYASKQKEDEGDVS